MRKVKLSWADQLRLKVKKSEDIISSKQIEHLSIEAHIRSKPNMRDSTSMDFYDSYILEKALYNLKIESQNQSSRMKYAKEDPKVDVEFHEQFFS